MFWADTLCPAIVSVAIVFADSPNYLSHLFSGVLAFRVYK
ncbi:MAG: hypothetical protein OFPI_34770 [Osedax symbiont Rs2]|nr:MAG: hypothetical protein OFPI_34770 [Osedax symbiont Rs2]